MRLQHIMSILLLLLLMASCSLPTDQSDYLTVSEAWSNYQDLEGQVVRVRGTVFFVLYFVDTACTPEPCSTCGTLKATELWITGKESRVVLETTAPPGMFQDHLPYTDGIKLPDFLHCTGSRCLAICSPVAPKGVEAYEVVGKLKICHECEPVQLSLDEIDYVQSKQLVEGKWQPLPDAGSHSYYPSGGLTSP